MRALTDTHTLVWALSDPDQLDCILIAQSIVEKAPLVSKDRQLAEYGVTLIW